MSEREENLSLGEEQDGLGRIKSAYERTFLLRTNWRIIGIQRYICFQRQGKVLNVDVKSMQVLICSAVSTHKEKTFLVVHEKLGRGFREAIRLDAFCLVFEILEIKT